MGPKKSTVWEFHVEGSFVMRTWDAKKAQKEREYFQRWDHLNCVEYIGTITWEEV